ncbi:MAG: leucine-rich repeat protein [Eubacteriales bacterium]
MRKIHFLFVLNLCMLMFAFGIFNIALAEGTTPEQYFSFDGMGTITDYDSINGPKDVVIPDTIEGIAVTAIGDNAFYYCSLTSVIIPDGVTYIGNYAFLDNKLTNVIIPDNVTSLGISCFRYNYIKKITIPASVTNISSTALSDNQYTPANLYVLGTPGSTAQTYASSVGFSFKDILTPVFNFNTSTQTITGFDIIMGGTNVVIPTEIDGVSVTKIGDNAFASKGITSVTFSNSVTSIGRSAFEHNPITAIVIPGNVQTIGELAFQDCDINNLIISEGVVSIGGHAFRENWISSIYLPDSVTYVGDYAFYFNTISSIRFSTGMTTLNYGVFRTNQLTSIIIPDHITNIGEDAFLYNRLSVVTIPASVTTITDPFFGNQSTPANLNILGYSGTTAQTFAQSMGYTFKDLLSSPFNFDATTGTIVGYDILIGGKSVVIPSSIEGVPVTAIGDNAFNGKGLTSITIPEGITSIGYAAFRNNLLSSLIIPESVISIGSYAFYGNGIISVIIPYRVTSIGEYTFYNNQLASITIPEGVTTIGNWAFYNNKLTSLLLPNGFTTIGEYAFYNNRLDSIVLPNSITSIGRSAFSTNLLTSVVIPEGVTIIKESTFLNNKISSVLIPEGVTSIEVAAFYTNLLTTLEIPQSVKTIGINAFYNNKLTTLTIPEGVTTIDRYAFRNNLLTEVIIPKSVTTINIEAFINNQTIPENLTIKGYWNTEAENHALACGYTYVYLEVILESGSLGVRGDSIITGLDTGLKYQVITGGGTQYVKADGALSVNEDDIQSLEGTEITGLTNGTSYKVETYVPTRVILDSGSLGVRGDNKITGLASGLKYQVITGGGTQYVKADGSLSVNEDDIQSLEGTEITGLTNGTSYKVETYVPTRVILDSGSLGVRGDNKITGLASGLKYQVITGGGTQYVKADGSLSVNEDDIQSLEGTEITGLTNGATYKVEAYNPTRVTLDSGSLGIRGDSKITGLTSGLRYKILVDSLLKYVKPDGTLTENVNEAEELIGTEITGLLNGSTYSVSILQTPTVTVSANPTQGGSVAGSGIYNEGSSVTINATPDSNYSFINWTEDGSPLTSSASYTFTLGTSDRNLIANYTRNTGTISGTVRDSSGRPISGATVSITVADTIYSSITASAGFYTITDVPTGTDYIVLSSKSGYHNESITSVDVTTNATTNVNIILPTIYITSYYTVIFHKNDGDDDASPNIKEVVAYGNIDIFPTPPIRSGYSFVGWNTEANGKGIIFTTTTIIISDITVYAQWIENTIPELYAIETSLSGNILTTTMTVASLVDNNNKAVSSITREQINNVIIKANEEFENHGNNTISKINFIVDTPVNVSTLEINIPKESLNLVRNNTVETFTVSTPVAAISFDQNALSTICNDATDDVKISISKLDTSFLSTETLQLVGDRPVLNIKVSSGDKNISMFGGTISVSIPYTPKQGEDINAIVIYFINEVGSPQIVSNCIYNTTSNSITFTTTHFSYFAVGYNRVCYNDVDENSWYYNAVSFIAAREITSGTGNGNYSPEAKLTRSQFLVLLMKAYEIAPDENSADNFIDAGNTYYTGYLAAAKRLCISSGVGNNMYAPDKEITRQEMFTLLYNALKVIGKLPQGYVKNSLYNYSDTNQIESWANEAMTTLVETGIISGSSGMLSPTDTTTRAEMAQVLYKLLYN